MITRKERVVKMKYAELRKNVQNWSKYPGTEIMESAPLIHRGFPGTFNSSFIEYHELDRLGGYFNTTNKDFFFSTIQSCIRIQDFDFLSKNSSWTYLGVFEMSTLTGSLHFKEKPDYYKLQKKQASELIRFFENLGISRKRVYPTYHAGGTIRDVTNGTYSFDFVVPEDTLSKEAFLMAGVPEENLLPDRTRDTFLSLHLHRPTPFGYRNEILVNVGTKEKKRFVDCATVEYVLWKPLYNGPETAPHIYGLAPMTDGWSIAIVGLERLYMVANGLKRVQDVDYIKPFYDYFEETTGKRDFLAGESLRALHRIYSDILQFDLSGMLSKNRKEKIKILVKNIVSAGLDFRQIEELLNIHVKHQPWHEVLGEGIEPTLERIKEHFSGSSYVRSLVKKERHKKYILTHTKRP